MLGSGGRKKEWARERETREGRGCACPEGPRLNRLPPPIQLAAATWSVNHFDRKRLTSHKQSVPAKSVIHFIVLKIANPLFSLRDINLTLGLLPLRIHVVWRDSVGIESSRSGLKSECTDFFHQSFLWLLRYTDEPQKGQNSCLWLCFGFFRSHVDVLQS